MHTPKSLKLQFHIRCKNFILLVLLLGSYVYSQCPSWKQQPGVEGDPADLPNGFLLYPGQGGIYKTPLNNFSPQKVQSISRSGRIFISDDGQWVLCGTQLGKIDGTESATVPGPNSPGKELQSSQYGIIHNSPTGKMEIFYRNNDDDLFAVEVDVSSGTPQFGNARTIASKNNDWWEDDCFSTWVSNDRLFHINSNTVAWYTIPDGGMGIATSNDFWQPENLPSWQCGNALTWDGTITSYNPESGCGSCIPTDHRGIVVVPFMEKNSPSANNYCDMYKTEALCHSINWPPQQYSITYDFHMYQFTNHNDYLSCRCLVRSGGVPRDPYGFWIVNWRENIWTCVTGKDLGSWASYSAAYITDATSSTQKQKHVKFNTSLKVPPDSYQIFSADGSRITLPYHGEIDLTKEDLSPGIYFIVSRGNNGTTNKQIFTIH